MIHQSKITGFQMTIFQIQYCTHWENGEFWFLQKTTNFINDTKYKAIEPYSV